jgi:hypothetical protein
MPSPDREALSNGLIHLSIGGKPSVGQQAPNAAFRKSGGSIPSAGHISVWFSSRATCPDLVRIDDALRVITPLRQHNPHDPAPVVYESLIRVDRGDVLEGIQMLLNHILQTTTDDKLHRYRWALHRYINALTLPSSRRGSPEPTE